MLEDAEIYQPVVSSAMIISTETKVIDNIIEVREPVLHHNEKDTPMYGAITEERDDVKKVVVEVTCLLTGNGLCNLLCEQYQDINFKCTIGATHAHTGKYLRDEDDTTA